MAENTERRDSSTHSKHAYRVLNEPFKIFGIIDWRYASAAAIPAVLFGLLAHSKIAGILVLCALAWRTYEISETDPSLPFAHWVSFGDKRKLCGFCREKR